MPNQNAITRGNSSRPDKPNPGLGVFVPYGLEAVLILSGRVIHERIICSNYISKRRRTV
jgi:hypothetical protein